MRAHGPAPRCNESALLLCLLTTRGAAPLPGDRSGHDRSLPSNSCAVGQSWLPYHLHPSAIVLGCTISQGIGNSGFFLTSILAPQFYKSASKTVGEKEGWKFLFLFTGLALLLGAYLVYKFAENHPYGDDFFW